jgi:hypothetical protein
MRYSEVRESYDWLQQKVYKWYGAISKQDIAGFIEFLRHDGDLTKYYEFDVDGQEYLPVDLEELIDEYIQKDYKNFDKSIN